MRQPAGTEDGAEKSIAWERSLFQGFHLKSPRV